MNAGEYLLLGSLGVWEGLRYVIVAFPGLFSYLFYYIKVGFKGVKLYRHVFVMKINLNCFVLWINLLYMA